jgi:hypothetical protein
MNQYTDLKPGEELDQLLTMRIVKRVKPEPNVKNTPHGFGTRFSTELTANHDLIDSVTSYGFEFQQTTRSANGPFEAVFRRDGCEFSGRSSGSQLMANCLAALKAADYLDTLPHGV